MKKETKSDNRLDPSSNLCRLIVNADDFGKSMEANRSITQSAAQGILTSTTVMANMPWAIEVNDFHAKHPEISIGLHVNLTEGQPLLDSAAVGTLIDKDGNFWSTSEFLRRVWLGKIQRKEIDAEVTAQLQWLLARIGTVSHLDSHLHIHSRSLHVMDAVMQVARSHGIKRIRSNRRYFVGNKDGQTSQVQLKLQHFSRSPLGVPGLVLTFLQNIKRRQHGHISPDAILTPFPTITTRDRENAVKRWAQTLRQLPPKTIEAIFHPGGGPQYEGQTEVLCHPELQKAIETRKIQLMNYSDLT